MIRVVQLVRRFSTGQNDQNLRVAIIGQSMFASGVYHKVKDAGHTIVGVFTIPDKGKKENILATEAAEDGVPVFKVSKWIEDGIVNQNILENYKALNANLNLLPFCTQFIPMEVINFPIYQSLCFHPSLLPKHRGASAINWTLINGDKKAGFTIFWANESLDAGPIFAQHSIDVGPNDTVESLYSDFLYPEGIDAMALAATAISKGVYTAEPQDESQATFEPAIRKKEQCMIRFKELSTIQLHNFVRGLDRVPGARIELENKLVQVFGSMIWNEPLPRGYEVEVKGMGCPGIIHEDGLILRGNDGGAINIRKIRYDDSGRIIYPSRYKDEVENSASRMQPFQFSDLERDQRQQIMTIWKNILGIDVDESTDFFKSGAGSMDVIRLLEEIRNKIDLKVDSDTIYTSPVFEEFVIKVFHKQRGGETTTPKLEFKGVTLRANGLEVKCPTQLFINNEFTDTISGNTIDCVNPNDESVICQVQCASKEDIDYAADCAYTAFHKGEWKDMNARNRATLMYKLADLMEEKLEELTTIECIDSGAVYTLALKTHIGMSIENLRYFAGMCDKIQGSTIPINNSRPNHNLAFTKKGPIGVCALITPWNYPLMMVCWKLGPCLAAGNTAIIKPSQQSPLSALKLAELSFYAGFPKGVINVLPGKGNECGEAICKNNKIRKIGFTGSTFTGKIITEMSSESNIKRMSLELGGKSPLIIFGDYDFEKSVKTAMSSVFFNKGENCIAAGRLFVEECIYDEFVKRVVEECKKMTIGDPLDRSTDHGPQNHGGHLKKLLEYIDVGVKEGAKLMYGGKRVDRPGYFLEPTVFIDVEDNMTIAKEESFGPIMIISKFPNNDVDGVLQRANATEYGLAGGVLTNNIQRALYVSDNLESGVCYINCYNKTDVASPFGGCKDSGYGKDLGEEALNEYLKTKTVTIEY